MPAIADDLTRDCFFPLRSNLKIVNNLEVSCEDKKDDRLWKVWPIVDAIEAACLKMPKTLTVSIGKQMIPFTGATHLKQYVPGKPHPTGLKNFVVASPNGMVLNFEIYQDKSSLTNENTPKLGVGPSAVVHLARSLPQGTALFSDRYLSTMPLLGHFAQSNLRGTGTIMRNRIPKDVNLPGDKVLMKKGRSSSCKTANIQMVFM